MEGPGAGRRTDAGQQQVQYRGVDLLLDAVAKGRQGWSARSGGLGATAGLERTQGVDADGPSGRCSCRRAMAPVL